MLLKLLNEFIWNMTKSSDAGGSGAVLEPVESPLEVEALSMLKTITRGLKALIIRECLRPLHSWEGGFGLGGWRYGKVWGV